MKEYTYILLSMRTNILGLNKYRILEDTCIPTQENSRFYLKIKDVELFQSLALLRKDLIVLVRSMM